MTRSERLVRILLIGLLLAILLAVGLSRYVRTAQAIEIHARLPEQGGWSPGDLRLQSGKPQRLRLTSDDVVHGFAIGQSDQPAVDVLPGRVTELTLLFENPGTYTYYCTRWCGLNHWRMRGTIEVSGGMPQPVDPNPPLYVQLGLDIDAEHYAQVLPERKPSAARGAGLQGEISPERLTPDFYRSHSPEQAWKVLRQEVSPELADSDVWDLVAYVWKLNASAPLLEEGQWLYAENCAACHGESGQGDGVFAGELARGTETHGEMPVGEMTQSPADFTKIEHMLSASPAHLQGKIIRGGMGTGMPYWGPILTEEQTWALVAYLWTFQFENQSSLTEE